MYQSKYWIPLASLLIGSACSPDANYPTQDVAEAQVVHGANDCTPNHGSLKSDRVVFNVKLTSGAAAQLTGYVYYQGSYNDKTLLVAAHGTSYNHEYWAAPTINNHVYSFSCYMAEQHYAVLALDLLGTGESSGAGQFDGDQLTYDESRNSLRQVLTQLRSCQGPLRQSFHKIVLVGHSLGSETALGVQAETHPADALVLTGWSHIPPNNGVQLDFSPYLGTPYVLLPNPVRNFVIYGPSADPAMIAYDNGHMADVLPRGVLTQAFSYFYQPAKTGAATVTGKVLSQLGQNDVLFPSAGAAAEASSYPHAKVTIQSLPTVAHGFNLHPENTYGWAQMSQWLHQNDLD